jgi:hypothetical protein
MSPRATKIYNTVSIIMMIATAILFLVLFIFFT